MKKTLMVLSFALCASFAFAQSNAVSVKASAASVDMARQAGTEVIAASTGYTGSIFTKDGDNYFSCTFSASEQTAGIFTTGIVGAGTQVDGTFIPQHTNVGTYGRWHRRNSDYLSGNDFTTTYPALSSQFGNILRNNIDLYSETPEDGFMLMSMIDNYINWGGDGDEGFFDAWIAFNAIDLTQCNLACCTFNQLYRAYNADRTYIDYSIDGGSTWRSYQINVHGVDVTTNNYTYGKKRVTLPRAIAGNTAILRLRYVDESTPEMVTGGTSGGYFWVLDDFTVMDAPENHLRFTSNMYFEGFYQMMPQGLQVPAVWAAAFTNDGNLDQTNTVGKLYNITPSDEEATVLSSKDLGTVVALADSNRAFVIDPLGYYDSAADYHGWAYDPDSSYKTGAYACLPTTETGAHYFFTDVNSSYYNNHIYDTLGTFDTLRYTVNYGTITDMAGQERPAGIWARDHGVLTYNGDGSNGNGNFYTPGLIPRQTAWTEDFNETAWNEAGYGTFVSYVTGRQVPAGWRILGVELVASTVPGMQTAGANLVPILWKDSLTADGLSFNVPENGTGAGYYTVKQSDVNPNLTSGYRTIGAGYNTVRILFPNQPRLDTCAVYRIGYRLAENADFTVAETRTNFMRADTTAYFSEEPGMTDYKRVLSKRSGSGNYYSAMTYDMRDRQIHFYNTSTYPMIRMIVGPSYHVTKHNVSWECDNEDFGVFTSDNNEILCGESDSVAEGYPIDFYIMPEVGYEIDKVTINGVETDEYTIETDGDGNEYGIMRIERVMNDMVFRCFFKEKVGFDPIAGKVSMKLQPNPATSNVFVSLKGVSGNVNMALIDMSGRVVTTSQFNAENGANINVSNLAKGAYFVRITNNNFTKIEKLIVR